MNINRNNYEAYFLDFIEGRLSPEQEAVLRRFLKFNPDLAQELTAFELHTVAAPHLPFPKKESLKKELPVGETGVNDASFDMYCVAFLEGDLSENQREAFEAYLAQHPVRKKELEAFKATYLVPARVAYPHKGRLKHRNIRLTNWRIMFPVAAAAAITLMMLLRVPYMQPTVEVASLVEPEQAEKQPDVEKEEKQPEVKPVQATFNMVRKTNSPVPVSDYSERQQERLEQQQKEAGEQQEQTGDSRRIAGVDLRKQQADDVDVQYDQLHPEIIRPPAINNSSLSLFALARYQVQKATRIMEEEDALLWSIASSGLQELNRITGSETQLMASRNEEGAISGIQFKSRFLNVTTPIAQNE
ncbi:MAG: hypothetical protein P1P82_07795 [Bacteroidales bacterium]|nr:hypothetical protein [Bacteroidales bacterium]MDT8430385.1 hypothetical protein [Bacteroidales bacterium]